MLQMRILLVIVLFGLLATCQAQQTLADKVNEAGVGWLIGDWEGSGDDGETVSLSFKWDLNQHVILLNRKSSRWESKGMNAVDPDSGHVKYVGVASNGGVIKGVWQEKDGHPMMKITAQSLDGRSWKGGIVFQQVDDQTMDVSFYGTNDAGELEESARGRGTFKKK